MIYTDGYIDTVLYSRGVRYTLSFRYIAVYSDAYEMSEFEASNINVRTAQGEAVHFTDVLIDGDMEDLIKVRDVMLQGARLAIITKDYTH